MDISSKRGAAFLPTMISTGAAATVLRAPNLGSDAAERPAGSGLPSSATCRLLQREDGFVECFECDDAKVPALFVEHTVLLNLQFLSSVSPL